MTVLAAVDPDRVTPGLLGFTVVLLLGLATWALLRSLDRHLKRVQFEEAPPEAPDRRPSRSVDPPNPPPGE